MSSAERKGYSTMTNEGSAAAESRGGSRRNIYILCGAATLVAVVMVVAIPLAVLLPDTGSHGNTTSSIRPECEVPRQNGQRRLSCLPLIAKSNGISTEEEVTEVMCESVGCCWDESPVHWTCTISGESRTVAARRCFMPRAQLYQVVPGTWQNTSHSWAMQLAVVTNTPEATAMTLALPGLVRRLNVSVTRTQSGQGLRLQITDANAERFQLPELPSSAVNADEEVSISAESALDVEFGEDWFELVVRRGSEVVFDTSVGPLLYFDQYLELSTALASPHAFGLGENNHDRYSREDDLCLGESYTLFNRHADTRKDRNLYGSQPYLINYVAGSSNVHGIMLYNGGALEVGLNARPSVTFQAISGVLDVYILSGPTHADVNRQLSTLLFGDSPHRVAMPPYWGLGFHTCRTTPDLEEAWQVVTGLRDAGIPHESDCGSVEFMTSVMFTLDTERFANFTTFVEDLHDHSQYLLLPQDVVIATSNVTGTYPPYDDGISSDVFIKSASEQPHQPFVGRWWRGPVVFVDFSHPSATGYWETQYRKYSTLVDYDGFFLDANTPANLENPTCSESKENVPPYLPPMRSGQLSDRTVCMDSRQNMSTHYNMHNYYSLQHQRVAHAALRNTRRPMLFSMSTFLGSGQYSGHWFGETYSNWTDMRRSNIKLLESSLFQIPFSGDTVCGYSGAAEERMCILWYQMASLQPVMFSHNRWRTAPKHPLAYSSLMVEGARDCLRRRYSLLPYMYTLMYDAHSKGDTVIRSVLEMYPALMVDRPQLVWVTDAQFFLGPAVMTVIFSKPLGDDTTPPYKLAYFPPGSWYFFPYDTEGLDAEAHGMFVGVTGSFTKSSLLLSGGHVVPVHGLQFVPGTGYHNYINQSNPLGTGRVPTTTASYRMFDFTLLVTIDRVWHQESTGSVFVDDGVSAGTIADGRYILTRFTAGNSSLVQTVENEYEGLPAEISTRVSSIIVCGVSTRPRTIDINGRVIESSSPEFFNHIVYGNHTLVINNIDFSLNQNNTVRWQ